DRNRRGRESALRKAAIALHEDHDLVFFDRRVDLLDYVRHLISSTSGSGTGPVSTSSRSAHALARASRRPAPGTPVDAVRSDPCPRNSNLPPVLRNGLRR